MVFLKSLRIESSLVLYGVYDYIDTLGLSTRYDKIIIYNK